MKKWIIAGAIILAALCFHPFEAADAGELLVAQTLVIEEDGDQISLWAAELHAKGKTTEEAAEKMKGSAPGTLFLRQTKRIIFCGGAEASDAALKLPEELPMGAVVYQSEESGKDLNEKLKDLEEVLEAREQRERDLPTLAQIKNSRYLEERQETGQGEKERHP